MDSRKTSDTTLGDPAPQAPCSSIGSPQPVTLGRLRLLQFSVLTTFLVVSLTLGLFELGARLCGLRVADDPFIHFGRVPAYFSRVNHLGEEKYKVTNTEISRSREMLFPVHKAPSTLRVFCIGSSASAGWPHPPSEAYSAYLEHALQVSYPERKVEVINVSAAAYALYRTRMIYQQVLDFEPDLIILYGGNNEFVENRRYQDSPEWLEPAMKVANKSLAYRLLRGGWVGNLLASRNTLSSESRQSVAFSEWSKIERMALTLRKEPKQFQRVKDHFEFCIEDILATAGARGIPVIVLTVPVNLREWPPNVSSHSATGSELSQWESAYKRGRNALLGNDAQNAVDALTRATQIDEGHAATHFFLARALEMAGRQSDAAIQYDLARDLDYNPFRAISVFNDSLRTLARRHKNAVLVDADDAFRRSSAPRAPGFDLFIDYVHPNKRGNLILAKLVHAAIVREGIGQRGPLLPEFVERPSAYDEYADLDLQFTLLQLFEIMRQDELVVEKAKSLEPHYADIKVGWKIKAIHMALQTFPRVVEQEQNDIRGNPVPEAAREVLARQVDFFYRENFRGYREFLNERRLEELKQ